MIYELNRYDINVELVEPVIVKTNFSSIIAKRSQDPDSEYSKMTKKMAERMEAM